LWSFNLHCETGFGTKAKVDDGRGDADPIRETGKGVGELSVEP
jgi:hypothetical protein